MTNHDERPTRPVDGGRRARAGAVRGEEGRRRPGPDGRADARGAAGARALPARGRAGRGEVAGGRDARDGVGGSSVRLQFTPDLVPSDIVGTRIYRPSQEAFDVELGPVFANLVLADEINRAPAKVQSALLEVMAERQVSIGGTTYPLPPPFLVLATQNPIESEGVYPLPEAQRDRFLMKVEVGHPSMAEEMEIVRRMAVARPYAEQVLTLERAESRRCRPRSTPCSSTTPSPSTPSASSWPPASRERWGLGQLGRCRRHGVVAARQPRARAVGQALAVLRGRDYVLPVDVADLAVDVLAHRLVLTYEALADGVAAHRRRGRCSSGVDPPQVAPSQTTPQRGVQHRSRRASRPWLTRRGTGRSVRRRAFGAATSRCRCRRRLDGLLQGDHLGHLPGPGTEPAEARATAPATTCAASTGRSPPAPASRTCGVRRRARARDDAARRPDAVHVVRHRPGEKRDVASAGRRGRRPAHRAAPATGSAGRS